MWHKHHQEKNGIDFNPEKQEVVGGRISFKDLEAWVREFQKAGLSQEKIEQRVEQSVINEFLSEAEKRHGRPLTKGEKACVLEIFKKIK